jgi:hypothetical protein
MSKKNLIDQILEAEKKTLKKNLSWNIDYPYYLQNYEDNLCPKAMNQSHKKEYGGAGGSVRT